MKYINKQQVLMLHSDIIDISGGTNGIRDEGMLDSALNAPFQTFDGMDLYPDIVAKAARLGYGLVKNHPFVDGNKRIGVHIMLLFLDINGCVIEYDDEDFIELILSIASGDLNYSDLEKWISAHIC